MRTFSGGFFWFRVRVEGGGGYVPVGGATDFDLCLHIVMVTGKCTDVFRGIFWFRGRVEGGELRGRILPWRKFSWGKRISIKGA